MAVSATAAANRPAAGRWPARRGATWWTVGAVGVVAIAAFWLVHRALIDDAYITLTYARNLAFHGNWGIIADHTSNTATSPLNVLLLAALTAVLRHPVWALGTLFVGTTMVLCLALLRTVHALRLPAWGALLACLLALANPLLLSTVGMETALIAAMLGLLLMTAARARPVAFGVVAGLAVLTRVDMVIFGLVLLAGTPALWRTWWRSVLAALAVTVPWFVVSWVMLGSAVADTLFLKTHQSWGPFTYANGLRLYYLPVLPAAVWLAVVPAFLAAIGFVLWLVARVVAGGPRSRAVFPVAVLAIGGVLYYLAYRALGVPPYHWYYGPPLLAFTIFLAIAMSAAPVVARWISAGVLVLLLAVQAAFDIHHGLPWREAALHSNWARAGQYATIGSQLPDLIGDHAVRSPGEIGTIAYFCHCRIIDAFSDRGRMLPIIRQETRSAGPAERWLLDRNFHFLDRSLKPISYDYTLAFSRKRPADALAVWRTTSHSARGLGYIALRRVH